MTQANLNDDFPNSHLRLRKHQGKIPAGGKQLSGFGLLGSDFSNLRIFSEPEVRKKSTFCSYFFLMPQNEKNVLYFLTYSHLFLNLERLTFCSHHFFVMRVKKVTFFHSLAIELTPNPSGASLFASPPTPPKERRPLVPLISYDLWWS